MLLRQTSVSSSQDVTSQKELLSTLCSFNKISLSQFHELNVLENPAEWKLPGEGGQFLGVGPTWLAGMAPQRSMASLSSHPHLQILEEVTLI